MIGWGVVTSVWIGQATADKLGVEEGGEITILASGRRQQMGIRKILKAGRLASSGRLGHRRYSHRSIPP